MTSLQSLFRSPLCRSFCSSCLAPIGSNWKAGSLHMHSFIVFVHFPTFPGFSCIILPLLYCDLSEKITAKLRVAAMWKRMSPHHLHICTTFPAKVSWSSHPSTMHRRRFSGFVFKLQQLTYHNFVTIYITTFSEFPAFIEKRSPFYWGNMLSL